MDVNGKKFVKPKLSAELAQIKYGANHQQRGPDGRKYKLLMQESGKYIWAPVNYHKSPTPKSMRTSPQPSFLRSLVGLPAAMPKGKKRSPPKAREGFIIRRQPPKTDPNEAMKQHGIYYRERGVDGYKYRLERVGNSDRVMWQPVTPLHLRKTVKPTPVSQRTPQTTKNSKQEPPTLAAKTAFEKYGLGFKRRGKDGYMYKIIISSANKPMWQPVTPIYLRKNQGILPTPVSKRTSPQTLRDLRLPKTPQTVEPLLYPRDAQTMIVPIDHVRLANEYLPPAVRFQL